MLKFVVGYYTYSFFCEVYFLDVGTKSLSTCSAITEYFCFEIASVCFSYGFWVNTYFDVLRYIFSERRGDRTIEDLFYFYPISFLIFY